jgi:CopG family transcriptional regulator, nickel-responsive regulator
MTTLVRFGVSLEKGLLRKFDDHINNKKYTNRSKAIRDLIRESLVIKEWETNKKGVLKANRNV